MHRQLSKTFILKFMNSGLIIIRPMQLETKTYSEMFRDDSRTYKIVEKNNRCTELTVPTLYMPNVETLQHIQE